MSRYAISAFIGLANLTGIALFASDHPPNAGALLAAILFAVIASTVMERILFGDDKSWRARFDPVVVLIFAIAFDLTLLVATMLERA